MKSVLRWLRDWVVCSACFVAVWWFDGEPTSAAQLVVVMLAAWMVVAVSSFAFHFFKAAVRAARESPGD